MIGKSVANDSQTLSTISSTRLVIELLLSHSFLELLVYFQIMLQGKCIFTYIECSLSLFNPLKKKKIFGLFLA